ncbi:MAG: TPR end-of-group domain-containing protein [Streptosporangiaceae bacterium]
MTDLRQLKGAITGLLGFAAAEEQILLATSPPSERGSSQRWAALPVVAHNTQFKAQQVHRLTAIRIGKTPEEFAEVDHTNAEVYQGYAKVAPDRVARDSVRVTGELIDGLRATGADDLFDPSRNPWLMGRQLWLQVVVRGFWHPTGHLADYYLAHGQPARAVALTTHAVTTARYLGVPDEAAAMATYNLACAQAKAGRLDEAAAAVRETVALNPGLRAKVGSEPDLAALRETGLLESAGV